MSWHNTAKFRRSAAEVNEAVGWRRTVFLPGPSSLRYAVVYEEILSQPLATA